jgi:hypothetical protein
VKAPSGFNPADELFAMLNAAGKVSSVLSMTDPVARPIAPPGPWLFRVTLTTGIASTSGLG